MEVLVLLLFSSLPELGGGGKIQVVKYISSWSQLQKCYPSSAPTKKKRRKESRDFSSSFKAVKVGRYHVESGVWDDKERMWEYQIKISIAAVMPVTAVTWLSNVIELCVNSEPWMDERLVGLVIDPQVGKSDSRVLDSCACIDGGGKVEAHSLPYILFPALWSGITVRLRLAITVRRSAFFMTFAFFSLVC